MTLPQQANGKGPATPQRKRPGIVIVGGGAGGLELATRLGRKQKANIVLIDKNPAHLWKPRLHEVAAGLIGSGDDEVNYLAHGRTHGYAFNMGELLGLDPVLKTIRIGGVNSPESGAEILGERIIPYDNLVLALGSRVDDFGIEGVKKYCLMLDGPDQARRFERQFFEAALQVASGRLDRLRVGIIGAGATGVELAAELHHAVHDMKRYGGLGAAGRLDILLVDKAERVLPAVDPQTSSEIMATLKRLGVKVVLGQGVVRVDADGFYLTNGEFAPCQIKVWASGVTGLAIVASLPGLTLTKGRRIAVDDHLVCIGQPDIYAIGDCAMIQTEDAREEAPPTAQAAHQQAVYLARALERKRRGKPSAPFAYRPRGTLVSLGRQEAVGEVPTLGRKVALLPHGWLPKFFYVSLYHIHRATLHGWPRAAALYVADILRRTTFPPIKLH